MDSGNFSGGPFVERFEEEFAAYCGTRHAIGVGSGTDALWLTLVAMGIGPGDEVITVPMTFVATVEAILRTGATPVFVDIDPVSHTMDPAALAAGAEPADEGDHSGAFVRSDGGHGADPGIRARDMACG